MSPRDEFPSGLARWKARMEAAAAEESAAPPDVRIPRPRSSRENDRESCAPPATDDPAHHVLRLLPDRKEY